MKLVKIEEKVEPEENCRFKIKPAINLYPLSVEAVENNSRNCAYCEEKIIVLNSVGTQNRKERKKERGNIRKRKKQTNKQTIFRPDR